MLETLYQAIQARKNEPQEGSYTNYLFDQGLDKILKKVGEEATEVVIAAKNEKAELVNETADLAYHLLVLLVEKEIPLTAVQNELENRIGKISPLKERGPLDRL